MRLEAIVVCVAMAQAVLPAGCVVITRVTVAPTVDTLGNLGADVRVSVTPAIGRRDDAGVWLGSDFGLSGSYLGTERVGAAQVRVGPELGLPISGATVIRFGLGYSGRFSGPLSRCSTAPISSALLNGGIAHVGLDAQLTKDYSKDEEGLVYVALGPELTGEYLWSTGPCEVPNRGLFSLGLSLSLVYRILGGPARY